MPDGSVELVLQAPDIEAPTALAVAPNGDVYYAEDPMDMRGPPTKNIDKVWLLKGGDPKKKVLVAENLWAVMGLEVVRDKLYCVHPPYVTVFTLDAEGKVAKREDLFTDLGPKVAGLPGFNDHVPSGIRMGVDGWLYVSIGDKGIPKMTRKEKDAGSVHVVEGRERRTKDGNHISLEGGGAIRFRPDGSGLEVFASGTRNHLDVPRDEHDRIFVRDNTDDGLGWNTRLMYLPPGGFLGYPWAYKQRPAETLPALADYGGGSPCGGYVYHDDGLPETYRGRVFHAKWGKGKVFAVKLTPDGAGFKAADEIKFMDPEGTGVQNFRPFTLRPTADGTGFYVTDWAYSGWSNPTVAGRLWKVTYTRGDVKPAARGTDNDEESKLLDALDHPALTERMRAQRELQARGWVPGPQLASKMFTPRQRQHLAWVQPSLGGTADTDPVVRMEAIRANAGRSMKQDEADRFHARLADIVQKDDACVRLAAADALGRLAGTPVPALRRLAKEDDLWVRHTLVRAAKRAGLKGDTNEHSAFDALVKETGPGRDAAFAVLADEYTPQAIKYLADYARHGDAGVRKAAIATLARNAKDRPPSAGNWWGTQPNRAGPPKRTVEWEGTATCRDALLAAVGHTDWTTRQAAVAALVVLGDPATVEPLRARFAVEKEGMVRAEIVRAVAALATPASGKFLADVAGSGEYAADLRAEAVDGLEKARAVAALATLTGEKQAEAVQVRALESLSRLNAAEARPAIEAALSSVRPAARRAAVLALAATKDVKAGAKLLPLLNDADAGVKAAAIQGLGALQAREAIPALLPLAGVEATQFDAVAALARMPDVRAVPAYLTGMAAKSPELRAAGRTALAAVRDKAAPVLEELAKRRELPAGALPELRTVFAGPAPVLKWRVVGPFPKDTKAVAADKAPDLAAALPGKGVVEVRWREVTADAGQNGRINLAGLYNGATDAAAYAFAEVESPADRDAEVAVGSDDGVTVWVNGKQVHQWVGNRAWTPAQDRVTVKLTKGTNRLLVRCYNDGGPWDMSAAISGDGSAYRFLQGAGEKLDLSAYRDFARKNKGDAERGGRLFADLKGVACIKCHAVGGAGGLVGPAMDGVGLKYNREELMTSILEPSKTIAQGYETVTVVTTAGKPYVGVFKGETGEALTLADAEGKTVSVPKKDIDERAFSPVSTMPNRLNEGMTLQDFADLVSYLEARREEKTPPKK